MTPRINPGTCPSGSGRKGPHDAYIHRIWLDDPLPAEYERNGRRWAEMHPGWVVRDWCREADIPPLRNQDLYDRAEEICPRDWKRFRSDLLRLELLHRYGGVYADCDSYPLRSLATLRGCHVAYSPNRGPKGERLLTQAVLVAPPEDAFIRACLDGLPAAVEHYRGRPLAQLIGPWHIDRTHRERDWPDVTAHDETFWTEWVVHAWANRRDNRRGGL